MLSPGVGAALAAAVLFGCYLYLYKRHFDVLPATVYTAVNEVAGFVWYLPIAALTWPADTAVLPAATTPADLALLGAVGVTVAAANIVSIRALKLGDASYVAPLNKLVPVFVLPIELLLLTTAIGAVQVGGVVLAVTAIYVANYETASALEPLRRAVTYRPAQLALGGALLFALGDVGTRAVLSTTPIPTQTTALFSFVAVAGVAVPFAVTRVEWPRLREVLPGLVALSSVFAVGVHLATTSFDLAPASIASPLINTQVIIVVLLGSLLLDEGHLSRRLAAAVLAVAGVALVATG
ncbi:EamA family transporter [Halobellus ruber]|uniref:EamA family transporter n=1 Tax=Halobellus ruber TaxID=2761102 RepID=A0A7J9SJR3_9EURY|nr:EamA family transporter [Halobellus ruber]MBB6646237.1 EamA family transporter [Halobellus ruber]